MKLVIVQDYLRSGGTERQTLFLASYMKGCGHEVQVVCFRPGGVLTEAFEREGISSCALQRKDTGLNFWAPSLVARVRAFQPDTVLCMGRMANAYVKRLKAALPHLKVFASVRTGKSLPWHNRRVLGVADGVVVNTRWWAQRLVSDHGLSAERVHVIYNGLTREWAGHDYAHERAKTRARYKLKEDAVAFVNVAGMRPGKRHDWLIERFAVLDLPDSQLWIVGEGVQQLHCKSLADRLGVGARVKFVGYQEDPYAWLAGADVAVSASVEDAQPNFLVEAQWVGLPCVAVDTRGVGECFIPGETGALLSPEDTLGFEEAMRAYATQSTERKEVGKKAQAYAREHFTREESGAAYLRAFGLE